MKALMSLLCACALLHDTSSKPNIQNVWQEWKQKFGKTYSTEAEETDHLKIWQENYLYVLEHNANTNREFDLEMNFLASQKTKSSPTYIQKHFERQNDTEKDSLNYVPQSWDWRTKGAIGPVRNQGQMGDAQSIVAAECVESYGVIQAGRLVDVSVMEVHDCCVSERFYNKGIFECIHSIGGLCSAASYPKSAGMCRNNTCSAEVKINGGKVVPSGDESAMMAAVYKMPVMALIDASHPSFQLYRSGIYSEQRCSSVMLDHVLQVVGYGSMDGRDYWICKNSWGTSWGENGYIRIARNKNNMCGIATQSQYPV